LKKANFRRLFAMTFVSSLLLSTFAALLGGGVVQANADSLPVRTLARGALSGIQEPTQEVVKDKAAWEKLWARHNSRRPGEAPLPEVDFAKEMVVFVAMGRRTTGGYNIHITQVEPLGDKLRISVQRISPAHGTLAIQVITAPFEIAAVPKSDLQPEFINVPVANSPKSTPR